MDPYWLGGFASGEACFTVSIYKSKTNLGKAVQLKFDLAQHYRDSEILISIKNYIGCGSVNKHSENAVIFTITKLSNITEKIPKGISPPKEGRFSRSRFLINIKL